MKDEYIWVQVGPKRQRLMKRSEIEQRSTGKVDVHNIIADTISPEIGPDGRVYDSRSGLEKAVREAGCYMYTRSEMDRHLEAKKAERARNRIQFDKRVDKMVADIAIDYHLSNKL